MTEHSEATAKEVHSLLLDARPEAGDANLLKAAHLARTTGANPRDPFQLKTFVAIRSLQTAIDARASGAEAEALLRDATETALHWATGR